MGFFDKLKETATNAANAIKNEYEELTQQQTPSRPPPPPPGMPPTP